MSIVVSTRLGSRLIFSCLRIGATIPPSSSHSFRLARLYSKAEEREQDSGPKEVGWNISDGGSLEVARRQPRLAPKVKELVHVKLQLLGLVAPANEVTQPVVQHLTDVLLVYARRIKNLVPPGRHCDGRELMFWVPEVGGALVEILEFRVAPDHFPTPIQVRCHLHRVLHPIPNVDAVAIWPVELRQCYIDDDLVIIQVDRAGLARGTARSRCGACRHVVLRAALGLPMAEPPCSHSDVEGRRRSKIFDDGDPPRDQDGGWRKKIVAFSPIILGGGALHQLLNSNINWDPRSPASGSAIGKS